MSDVKISIAMATFNGAKYLKAQLQSFVDQTHQPDELIITDDCSTDGTEAIVLEFTKTAPFVVEFYRNDYNLGYCGNFNAALMKTTGDLVFLSDQDDVWFPEKIEHMLNVAKCNPEALVVMNDAALTDGDLNDAGLTKLGQIHSGGLTKDSFVMGCCCGIRRELLDLRLPIPAGFRSHDNWLVWFADGLGVKVVDETVLQFYRLHGANESNFVVNSTKKVTRRQVIRYLINNAFNDSDSKREREELKQLSIFSKGVNNVMETAPDKYRVQLANILFDAEDRFMLMMRRISIRKKRLFPRFISVVCLLKKGGYKNANGYKSALRDLIG